MESETRSAERIVQAIIAGARDEIRKMIEEESEKAKREVEKRIAAAADRIALSVVAYARVEMVGTEIVITVKKDVGQD